MYSFSDTIIIFLAEFLEEMTAVWMEFLANTHTPICTHTHSTNDNNNKNKKQSVR